MYGLANQLGHPIVIAAAGFTAYLLGGTAGWAFNSSVWTVRRYAHRLANSVVYDESRHRRQQLGAWVLGRLSRDPWDQAVDHPIFFLDAVGLEWPEQGESMSDHDERWLRDALLEDLRSGVIRLVSSDPARHAEIDRMEAEGQMFANLSGGALPLAAALLVTFPRWWWLILPAGILVIIVLAVRASSARTRAREELALAARVGGVELPKFRAQARKVIDELPEPVEPQDSAAST
ncbi:hypothetical protein DLJ46_32580 [Micromonospora globispora]|uniref:Uncharacterized protein n=1 Tax=Micromonospora globispora TaxID=1450148 RepID=A0A317JUR5_9ACTN|nr:hypothetical protein [Micromonospora globispora]PWU43182.1 hypothetical protein DLJ46_32580 [Micromonospora globispora]